MNRCLIKNFRNLAVGNTNLIPALSKQSSGTLYIVVKAGCLSVRHWNYVYIK